MRGQKWEKKKAEEYLKNLQERIRNTERKTERRLERNRKGGKNVDEMRRQKRGKNESKGIEKQITEE